VLHEVTADVENTQQTLFRLITSWQVIGRPPWLVPKEQTDRFAVKR
jgi:hypothetical protein